MNIVTRQTNCGYFAYDEDTIDDDDPDPPFGGGLTEEQAIQNLLDALAEAKKVQP